ncbi:DUF6538 domain-containing protein [Caulobacter sp. ErkDOM-YI]|uniref:DUF6538 domain-containing protein n=1 Tax=unclassified Caulobacter TaxID=2648921 RepID=UPI003AF7907D
MPKRSVSVTLDTEQRMPMGTVRRGASYAIRRVIPKDLKAHFGREVDVKTLGTTDFAEAKSGS